MSPKDADRMANGVGAVLSGSTLFAQACLSKNLGSLHVSNNLLLKNLNSSFLNVFKQVE